MSGCELIDPQQLERLRKLDDRMLIARTRAISIPGALENKELLTVLVERLEKKC